MSGIAELAKLVIYAIVILPPLVMLIIMLLNGKKFFKKGLRYLFFTSIPLMLLVIFDITNHKNEELGYVGVYYLTEYPDCTSCQLELKENNTYTITKGDREIESGSWNYRSGSDYWIVDIGEFGQLGTGNYAYYHKKEK